MVQDTRWKARGRLSAVLQSKTEPRLSHDVLEMLSALREDWPILWRTAECPVRRTTQRVLDILEHLSAAQWPRTRIAEWVEDLEERGQ